jgi:hypothetical protein
MYLVYEVFFSLQAFISFCALVVVCLYSLNGNVSFTQGVKVIVSHPH